MNDAAVSRPAVAASGVIVTPLIRSPPMVSEMLPPRMSAPAAASRPMTNAARIVEMAFAPIAGANGGELLLAPSTHAMNRQVTIAVPTRTAPTVRPFRLPYPVVPRLSGKSVPLRSTVERTFVTVESTASSAGLFEHRSVVTPSSSRDTPQTSHGVPVAPPEAERASTAGT